MEGGEVKKRGRGRPRKRRRSEEEEEAEKVEKKKESFEIRWRPLVGRYVLKEFKGSGVFLGKIVYYETGLYRVDYEDGDCEDLESGELGGIILGDSDFDDDLIVRKKRLDELVLKKSVVVDKKVAEAVHKVEISALTEFENADTGGTGDGDEDGDSSCSDSCDSAYDRDRKRERESDTLSVPPPELPPSSGNVGVPQECVSHLFSVYAFLRSFNIRLFLSPFALDDLVGSINSSVQNSLLDAIHVALLRALRRHLHTLESDASHPAVKCLRCVDWSLLDSLTWPVYLVHYFTIMGYVKGPEWKGFYDHIWRGEYYSLPVGWKLMILQILCDDILECAELRAEIDMREESEVGFDPDAVTSSLTEIGPRRVHPRYSKTSACKDREAMEIIAETQGTKSSCTSRLSGCKGTGGDADALHDDDDVADGNGDECRLCGMDGTLLCCDGCPSSYHSRCIGVSKMHIPEGPWYCPECTINKLGPTIITGTSLRGAEVFGIDLFEQVFLGTCNHLLVISGSSREPCFRYYNQMDLPKVLQALSSSTQHRSLYFEISKAIAQYWNVPQNAILETAERGYSTTSVKVDELKESYKAPGAVQIENAICLNGNILDNISVSCLDAYACATSHTNSQGFASNGDEVRTEYGHLMNMKQHEQIILESTESVNQQTPSDVTQQSLVDRSGAMELTTCTSSNSVGNHVGHPNGTCLPAVMSCQSKEGNHSGFELVERNSYNNYLYMGTYFKPHAYINHYMHGDFAASAAANLAILSSEESRVSEIHNSGSSRKVISDISLQVKAFSTAASRFFWPSSEKKLMDVPRERCGWCHSCKIPSSNRRGCMLNSALLAATKGAMKIISGLRPAMNGEGSFPSISTYILYLEEMLCGLTVGHFQSLSYRKQWRKQVEDASTCRAIKSPLLELEENIRRIALSRDWVNAMDDWLIESSGIQSALSTVGTTQKRGPSGKRQRKQSTVIADFTAVCSQDKNFIWWRGGKLLNLVFHKAILPRSMAKRAARQGGSRKISGIHYDDSDIPKRSRELVWKAAVERSKNTSQLALQIRYLDFHVRWSDLVRPEQNLLDGKGSETEGFVFRNAIICNKKIEESKVTYAVAFWNQRHISSRIMKNIIEIEQRVDGKDKYWFSESHIPLYLVKEYEERLDKEVLLATKKPSNELSELQRRQLKASRRDIFSYLACKRDKLDNCSCASCQQDVLLRNSVKCCVCEGFCHKDCTISSMIYINEEVAFSITCKQCYNAKAVTYNQKSNESPTSPLPLQGQKRQNALTVNKGTRIKVYNQPLVSARRQETSERKLSTSASSLAAKARTRLCNWGLIWKKKSTGDTGIDFRSKNILLQGSSDGNWLNPVCNLCKKEYDSNLIYIHCETCNYWFHADALEFDESKLFDLVGFKCCRCRRIKPPWCPYKDEPEGGKAEGQKSRNRVLKQENVEIDSDSGTITESIECEPATPMFPMDEVVMEDNHPLLFSLSRVEQITDHSSGVDVEWNIAGQGAQKLPVRRQAKRPGDVEGISENNIHDAESSLLAKTNNLMNHEDEMSCAEWDISGNGLEGEMQFDYDLNYEDMEFEPQTYFSFTELLEADDGFQLDGCDASGNVLGNCENECYTVSQDGVPKQDGIGTSRDQLEPSVSEQSAVNRRPCNMCSHWEPPPDLFCEICAIIMHHHCSPWVESLHSEGSWRCGKCRDWQ